MSMVDEIEGQDNQWTMNCVIFGAELFRSLHRGQISKDDAVAKIKNLTGFTDEEATYLLKRVQDLREG